MNYIIDRIEDGIAVLECTDTPEGIIEIPRKNLPKGVREGQVLCKDGDTYTIDHEATQRRREMLRARLDRILKKG